MGTAQVVFVGDRVGDRHWKKTLPEVASSDMTSMEATSPEMTSPEVTGNDVTGFGN